MLHPTIQQMLRGEKLEDRILASKVACPYCKAEADKPCTSMFFRPLGTILEVYHSARIDLGRKKAKNER